MEAWSEHSRFAIGLFALISPLPVIPIFLGLTGHLTSRERRMAAGVAALTLFVALSAGHQFGEALITALGSSIASFQIAGGIIIAISGFKMLNGSVTKDSDDKHGSSGSAMSIGIVPIGIPLLAGPGSLTAVMLEGHSGFTLSHESTVFSIVVGCSLLTGLILFFSDYITRVLGALGLLVFERVFGLIVISIGIEVLIRGIYAHGKVFLSTM